MFKPKETADVAIVGAGVIGLAIARALRQRGYSSRGYLIPRNDGRLLAARQRKKSASTNA